MSAVEVVVESGNTLGEGVIWSERDRSLYWTDIEDQKLWSLDPGSGSTRTVDLPERLCSFAQRESGGFLFAFASGFVSYDPDADSYERICNVEEEKSTTRLNDGRCDRQGRFVVGGFDADAKGSSGAYRLDSDLSLHFLFGGLSSANSTCFSPDGKIMYHADTPQGEIWVFDYDTDTGKPSNRRTFCRFDDQPGMPDGSIVDAEGCLWNAQWNGGRVVRYRPDGTVDRIVEVPVMNPTCVAFGGSGLDTLFITSAKFTMTEDQLKEYPLSGALLAVRPGVTGIPDPLFKG